ncbi:MAG: hypothetical protein FJZ59_05225 [Chlamydiae bacterium]|jgi:hypothetical protein|nr:hypothetical protein [Chlamydiota bacterium]
MLRVNQEREPTHPITRRQIVLGSIVIGLIYLIGTKNIQKFALAVLSKTKTFLISSIEISGPFTLQAICFAFFRNLFRIQQQHALLDRRRIRPNQ